MKLLVTKSLLAILGLSYIACLSAAVPSQQDPLQSYRDEINQAENNASQTLLDHLQDEPNNSVNYSDKSVTNTQPAQPPSNQQRAFKLPDTDNPTVTNNSNTTNSPWVKPNPWENAAKVNPWANAPIPSPSPNQSTNTLPSPPNIFAPSQQQAQSSNKS